MSKEGTPTGRLVDAPLLRFGVLGAVNRLRERPLLAMRQSGVGQMAREIGWVAVAGLSQVEAMQALGALQVAERMGEAAFNYLEKPG